MATWQRLEGYSHSDSEHNQTHVIFHLYPGPGEREYLRLERLSTGSLAVKIAQPDPNGRNPIASIAIQANSAFPDGYISYMSPYDKKDEAKGVDPSNLTRLISGHQLPPLPFDVESVMAGVIAAHKEVIKQRGY